MSIARFEIPKPLSAYVGERFEVSEMGPGLKRGMVLKVYKAKIRDIAGDERFLRDLDYATLLPTDGPGYAHPRLVIRFSSGSIWIPELHMQRYRLKNLINERLGCDFLKEVRVK